MTRSPRVANPHAGQTTPASDTASDAGEVLFSINAPHFNCGIIVSDGVVIRAAPILKWAVGKRWSEVQDYFNRKKYGVTRV